MPEMTNQKRDAGAGLRLAMDFGPLLIFFVVNFLAPGPKLGKIFIATGAFMIATAVAMVFSKVKTGRISPMQLFSGVMVLILGGAAIVFHNETFIKVKPTIYYGLVASMLFFGLLTGKPVLKTVLGSSYPGLTERGWTILTRNWALFFVGAAILNEAVWRHVETETWLGFKIFGMIPLTLLFAGSQIPMLLRNGMGADAIEDSPPVPPGN
jgi:intracellular septation protein